MREWGGKVAPDTLRAVTWCHLPLPFLSADSSGCLPRSLRTLGFAVSACTSRARCSSQFNEYLLPDGQRRHEDLCHAHSKRGKAKAPKSLIPHQPQQHHPKPTALTCSSSEVTEARWAPRDTQNCSASCQVFLEREK